MKVKDIIKYLINQKNDDFTFEEINDFAEYIASSSDSDFREVFIKKLNPWKMLIAVANPSFHATVQTSRLSSIASRNFYQDNNFKTRSNMKKRYFYVVASFMRKDIAKTQSKVDLTIMKEDGSALFPLMEAIKVISEGYSEIADPATIQFDNYFEISKEDYEAFNKAKNLVKVNK